MNGEILYYANDDEYIDGEEWRPVNIEFYSKIFMVSNLGRVKRLNTEYWPARILKQSPSRNSCYTALSHGGKNKMMMVHRLVAMSFLPNPNNLPIVMHLDDDPHNCKLSNLKWGTQSDNVRDCHAKGRAAFNLPKPKFGKDHPAFGMPKPYHSRKKMSDSKKIIPDSIIESIRLEHIGGARNVDLCKKYNIQRSYMSSIVNNRVRVGIIE